MDMKPRILIKLGGRAFDHQHGYRSLARAINTLRSHDVIIVHGGGSEISKALREAHREPRFIDGYRITEKEDIDIVEDVLSHRVNGRIARDLTTHGLVCQQLSGKTNGLFQVRPLSRNGIDLGFVGEIEHVTPTCVIDALDYGRVPVVSPISADPTGNSYNVNADSAAAALAVESRCTDLVFFTDVPGIQVAGVLTHALSVQDAKGLIDQQVIRDGMVAKIESAFKALEGGVCRVHITCWQHDQTLSQIIHKATTGTTIQKDKK